ncbi:MAG: hypothetical protein IPP39_09795 [Chitinophagaceae bacterium]|nr:hypothetical protein [Chitinophagaceae bacterium]
MKKLLIAILFPAIAIHSAAQDVQPVAPAVTTDTITKTKIDSVPTIAAQTDSLKITKKPKRKKNEAIRLLIIPINRTTRLQNHFRIIVIKKKKNLWRGRFYLSEILSGK